MDFFYGEVWSTGFQPELVGRCPVEQNVPGGWEVHGAGQIEQRGLAASTAPDKANEFAQANLHRHIIEGANGFAVGVVVLRHAFDRQKRPTAIWGRQGMRY